MYTDLTTPCAECPFRKNRRGYLRGARAAEIVSALLNDQSFTCHKTLQHTEADDGETTAQATPTSQHCAGAMLLLEYQGRPNQWMRIALRLRWYDPIRLNRRAPVFCTVAAFVAHHTWWTERSAQYTPATTRTRPVPPPVEDELMINPSLPAADHQLILQLHTVRDLPASYLQYDRFAQILHDQLCLSSSVFVVAQSVVHQMHPDGGFRAAALAALARYAPSSEEQSRLIREALVEVQTYALGSQDAALLFIFAELADDLREDAQHILNDLDLPEATSQQLQLLLTEPSQLYDVLTNEEA